jgi:thymidine kinase
MNTRPRFVLYTGPMFSSKTTKLLSRIDRSRYQKKKTVSFKPNIDDRYSIDNQIITHNDLHTTCYNVSSGEEILNIVAKIEDADIIAVDELFMIQNGGSSCIELFKKGYDVYVSSIELNFLGEPFNEIKEIMPYCTHIVKCKAVCTICQEDARYTTKKESLLAQSEILHVGGEETYEARCQLHHNFMRS